MKKQSFENLVATITDAVKKASPRDSSIGAGRTGKGDGLDLLVDAIEDLLRRSRESATAFQSAQQAMLKPQITGDKGVEEELSQERILLMRRLEENIPDKVYFKDTQGRFLHVSGAHARLFNLKSVTDAIGKTDFDFFTKEHAQAAFEDEQRIIHTGEPIVNKEEKETWPDRPDTWVSTTKMPLRDQQGVIVGTFGISRDISERKQAEEALRKSEERYRNLLEQAADGIFLLDENYNFLMANSEICEMLGCAPEELLRLNILDTYPNELRDIARARNEKIKLGGRMRFERPLKRKDGSVFPVEMSARKLADGTMQGIAHDITERKRMESELALERSLLYALMENIPDYIYFKDTENRFIRTSRAHARMFGLGDATEAIGKTDMDFFSEEHARKAYEDEQRIIRTGEPILNVEEKETWLNRPDTWVLTTKMPLRDQGRNIIGTFGISRDITERKRAEERILSLARFPDESPHPVMRVTPDGSVIYANKASEPLTSSWMGGDFKKVPSEFLGGLTHAWESGEKQEIEIREATATYTVTIVPFVDAGYINLYGRDVTEEKSLAERLIQAQKMEAIGQLAGGIAHDFNNILQVITGYCEVLKQSLREESQKYVLEITLAARRAATLTAQLLAFSRKQILRPRVVNTKELFHSMQRMLERVIGEEIELRTFINPDTGNIQADAGQMEQVLLNLAVNARDAMPSGGRLTMETSNRTFDEAYVRDHLGAKVGQYVCIAVSDTGVGMDRETLSHIYEPFFTTKEQGKGTGLGLATVYGIVKQSGGYINCYSELGRGTTFTIYLPLTLEEADKPFVAAAGTTASRGRETVLLVEDDGAVRRFARSVLEDEGYLVIEASGGEEALSDVFAHSLTVALLVTDVVMPRMSGKELARRLEEICPKVKVLYVSGYTSNAISRRGILDAGVDFMQKPFSSLEFLAKVREILDRP